MKIGRGLYRFRWLVLGGWAAVLAALALAAPRLDPAANERESFLPDGSDHSRATRALRECFPDSSGLSEGVVVFERADGELTAEDLRAIEAVAEAMRRPRAGAAADLAGVTVRSPASIPLPANPLKSPDGRAALVVANLPANFVTIRSARIVDHIRGVVASADLPGGLAASVTGSGGFGHDYAEAAERSHRRTLMVTLAAVVCILLLVYRSPVASVVPLLAISAAAFVAMKVLAFGQAVGMHIGTAERIFVVVLIYGAGTDYSLLFLSRFRELSASGGVGEAVARGWGATFWAILASAGTDAAGLLMLCFADYGVFRTAGPAMATALLVALAAAVTLVPAMAGVLGRVLFWPGRRAGYIGLRHLWPRVAQAVTARPGTVLAVTLALMAAPAVRGLNLTWVYDALAELEAHRPEGVGNAAAGIEAAKRHWPVGQIAPVTVLLRSGEAVVPARWRDVSRGITEAVAGVRGVRDVRSLTQPVGGRSDWVSKAFLAAAKEKVRAEYVSAGYSAMRLQAVLDRPALDLAAMEAVRQIRRSVTDAVRAAGLDAEVHLVGATPEIIDIGTIARRDFRRVAALALAVIFLMVLGLLRDPILSAFMIAGTVLGYLATLGLSYWVFAAAGSAGLDWKVEIFLFVVMVAVGVDYSIFLAARLAQEAREVSLVEATRRAVVHTGPVISSCGVIMAATLGSLMASELKLLVQLGFALALGMMVDTFVVRPLLLPAFIALTGRTGRITRALE